MDVVLVSIEGAGDLWLARMEFGSHQLAVQVDLSAGLAAVTPVAAPDAERAYRLFESTREEKELVHLIREASRGQATILPHTLRVHDKWTHWPLLAVLHSAQSAVAPESNDGDDKNGH